MRVGGENLVQDWAVVLTLVILVVSQRNDIFERQRFAGDWMFVKLPHIWQNVGQVVDSSVSCASL